MPTDLNTMEQIIANVFDSMLEMPTSPVTAVPDGVDSTRCVAAIRITGCVSELIVVEAPLATACAIGETMFAAEPGTLEDDEISDAVGEVVNMIGGNVKGLQDGESTLSLPCVSCHDGSPDTYDPQESLWVQVAGHPLLVRWQDMEPLAV